MSGNLIRKDVQEMATNVFGVLVVEYQAQLGKVLVETSAEYRNEMEIGVRESDDETHVPFPGPDLDLELVEDDEEIHDVLVALRWRHLR